LFASAIGFCDRLFGSNRFDRAAFSKALARFRNDLTSGPRSQLQAEVIARSAVGPAVSQFCSDAKKRVPSSATTTRPSTTTSTAAVPPSTTRVALMPDVVCMNLQAAQDRIQQEGVFFSRSADGTGLGRSQLIDSNWIVTDQTPPPGTPFGEGDAVLTAVKYGEPAPC
jgi:hypothetical protein